MSFLYRILPQPVMTIAIVALWMALAPDPRLGHLLLAILLGVAIPWTTQAFWPDRPRIRRPFGGIALFVRVVGDIIVANLHVARLVLGPLDRLRPDFVEVPLEIPDPFIATLLGSIVSLTPGTVSIEIDRERNVLLVHGLDIQDRQEVIAKIKSRYEVPLKEIFGC